MNHNKEFKSFEPDERIQHLIENRIRKLETKLQAFRADSTYLKIFIERNAARKLYRVTLTMDVPGKTIAAKDDAHDPALAIKAAFDEVESQAQKHKEALRHERLWKRIAKRDELRRTKAAMGKEWKTKQETFFPLVNPHLEWLDHFIDHLIRYSEAMGELAHGDLKSVEVVDEALIRAYREFLKNVSLGDVRSWLTRLAVDRLHAEINRLSLLRHQAPVHIEEDIPETPPREEVWQLGEEILYFYQPDEDLKVEDVIADPGAASPEEELVARELQECVGDALREVPDDWRRILLMHYSDDEPVAKIAESLGKTESEVRRVLSYSTRYVREKLIESGCTLTNRKRAA
jgi:RNA polymerase sigma factor (sigma-70 family)